MDYSKRKSKILGAGFCASAHQLRKMLLFSFVQKCGEDKCFRCGNRIDRIEDLSIEHKNSWQSSDNPKKSFFDLNNIAFSHSSCNFSARKQTKTIIGKSGYKGVTFKGDSNRTKPWKSAITIKNRYTSIGNYETAILAAKAFDEYSIKIWGINAITNKSLGLL